MSRYVAKYPLDLGASKSSNFITGEVHSLESGYYRVVVPKAGAFYTNSLIVRNNDASGALLQEQTDYIPIHYYEQPSVRSGREVCASILILVSETTEVEIEYRAVGGEYESIVPIIEKATNQLDNVQLQQASWGDLFDKPNLFPPAPHLHWMTDVYGMESITHSLGYIYEALLYRDAAARVAISEPNELDDGVIEPRHLSYEKDWYFDPLFSSEIRAVVGDQVNIEGNLLERGIRIATRNWVSANYAEPHEIQTEDWNKAYDDRVVGFEPVDGVQDNYGNNAIVIKRHQSIDLELDLTHIHDYADLPITQDEQNNWNDTFDKTVTGFSLSGDGNSSIDISIQRENKDPINESVSTIHTHGGLVTNVMGDGNGTLTVVRSDANIDVDLSHNHNLLYTLTTDLATVATSGHFDDLDGTPDIATINDSVDRSITGVSGNGNSTLELHRYDGGFFTQDLSHSHDNELANVQGDGNSTVTFFRNGSNIEVDFSHDHSGLYPSNDDLSNVAFSGSYNDLSDTPNIDANTVNDAYNANITNVSGNGNNTLTLTRRDSTSITTDLMHTHSTSDISGLAVVASSNLLEDLNSNTSTLNASSWDTAYDRSPTNLSVSGGGNSSISFEIALQNSGNLIQNIDTEHTHPGLLTNISHDGDGGNGSLTFNRDGDDLTVNLVHSHSEFIDNVSGSGSGTLTLTRRDNSTIDVDLTHSHGYTDLPMSDTDTDNWNTAYDRSLIGVDNDENGGNGTLTLVRYNTLDLNVDLSHTHDYSSLPFGNEEVTNWTEAYNNYISALSGHGNETVTFTRNDDSTFTHDLSHTHDYDDLPISNTDTNNWNTAYDRSLTGASGSGNGTLNLSQQNGLIVSADLSHNHDQTYLRQDNNLFDINSVQQARDNLEVVSSSEMRGFAIAMSMCL